MFMQVVLTGCCVSMVRLHGCACVLALCVVPVVLPASPALSLQNTCVATPPSDTPGACCGAADDQAGLAGLAIPSDDCWPLKEEVSAARLRAPARRVALQVLAPHAARASCQ